MLELHRRVAIALAAFFLLTPSEVPAQTTATSFDELRRVLKDGQAVVVTDASGRRTKGRVASVSASPPLLVVHAPDARTFAPDSIGLIRAVDPVWTGAVIGGSVGFGLALWDYLIDPSEPGNAAIFTVFTGVGAAVGLGLDAAIKGKVLFRSPGHTARLTVAPLVANHRKGVLVSLRF